MLKSTRNSRAAACGKAPKGRARSLGLWLSPSLPVHPSWAKNRRSSSRQFGICSGVAKKTEELPLGAVLEPPNLGRRKLPQLHPAVDCLRGAAQQFRGPLGGQGVRLVRPAPGQPLPEALAVLRGGAKGRLRLGPGLGRMVGAELPRQLPKKACLLLHTALEGQRVLPPDTVPVGGLARVLVGDAFMA